jgi:hypothetical protein
MQSYDDSDVDSYSSYEYEIGGEGYYASESAVAAARPRKINVCTIVMSVFLGQKTETQRREEVRRHEQEEQQKVSKYISFDIPYVWVKKPMVLQESQLFYKEAYPNPLFCLAVLGRLLRLHSQGLLKLDQAEVTELFFGLTKLFSTSTIASPMDQCVRRMVYWLLSEVTGMSQPEERMMLLSSLTKDMTDRFTPALRARALRLLPCILIRDDELENPLEKLSQTIAATKTISTTLPCSLDPTSSFATSRVITGALVSLCQLLQHEQSAQLISYHDEGPLLQQCHLLAATALGSHHEKDFRMVQFHALQAVLSFDRKNNDGDNDTSRVASVSQLIATLIQADTLRQSSPLTLVILIRHIEQTLLQGIPAPSKSRPQGSLCATTYNFFLEACLLNACPIVVVEAARVVINLAPDKVPFKIVEKAVSVMNRFKATAKQTKTVKRVADKLLTMVGKKLVQTLSD